MEGLEISEVPFSTLITDTETKRMDSDFFNREALAAQALVTKNLTLGELVKDGYRVVYESTETVDRLQGEALGWPYFLQSADITTPFINAEAMGCVTPSDWARYPKGRIQPGELLIEVKGKAEKVAIVPDDFPSHTLVTGTCFKLTTKTSDDRYWLLAYLSCRYGQLLKDRLKTNLLVSYLAKEDLYSLPVPRLNPPLVSAIKRVMTASFELMRNGRSRAEASQDQLMKSLYLGDDEGIEPLCYTRSSDEAFAAGRLDAEHFRPQYIKLIENIQATGNAALLGDLLTVNQRGKQPEYTGDGMIVVNSKHVANGDVTVDADNRRGRLLIRQ